MQYRSLGIACCALLIGAAASWGQGWRLAKPRSLVEQKIHRTLETECQLELIDIRLEEVSDYLQDIYKVPVAIDRKSLSVIGIDIDEKVSCNFKGITLKSALTLLLRDYDLAWKVENEVLQITAREPLLRTLVTEVYDLSDMLSKGESADKLGEKLKEMLTLEEAQPQTKPRLIAHAS